MTSKQWWLHLPAAASHELAGLGTELYSFLSCDKQIPVCDDFTWRGIYFPNRWGIAGGVDKNADHLSAWWNLGCGFVEVGTVTLKPQNPNAGRIIDRNVETQSLWNKMGFPGEGCNEVVANLQQHLPYRAPVFVNIGKNRTTKDQDAPLEYAELYKRLKNFASAFVINVSSPNTQGLRQWLEPSRLETLLAPILAHRSPLDPPVLLKLSPDQSNAELEKIMLATWNLGIAGFILTNTTLARTPALPFSKEGGVSGAPLKARSEECLRFAVDIFKGERNKRPLIVSVGGVMTAEDVFARLNMGADLVQCYAALVYSGPRFFKHVAQEWKENQPTLKKKEDHGGR